jgi:hypothetical protein
MSALAPQLGGQQTPANGPKTTRMTQLSDLPSWRTLTPPCYGRQNVT